MRHSRRRILWLAVTAHPTAEWLANQLTQAFGWSASGLPDPRPGCLLWQSVRSAGSFPRYSRSSDITAFALAERLFGAPDRFDSPGMSRPCRCVRRAAPAAFAAVLHGLLQHRSNAPIAGERRACPAPCARSRTHPITARPRWIASSIYPDLIYGRDRAAMVPMLPNKPRGVPRVNDRRVLNGIFWVLRSGAPWRDLPQEFGPYTTCYNRFVRWRRAGVSNSTQTPSLP